MKSLSRLMVPYGSAHGWWAPVLGQNPVAMVILHLTAVESERARGRGDEVLPQGPISSSWVSPPRVPSTSQNTATSRAYKTFPIDTVNNLCRGHPGIVRIIVLVSF